MVAPGPIEEYRPKAFAIYLLLAKAAAACTIPCSCLGPHIWKNPGFDCNACPIPGYVPIALKIPKNNRQKIGF